MHFCPRINIIICLEPVSVIYWLHFLHRIWFLLLFFSKDLGPTGFLTLKFNVVAQRSPTTLPSRLSFSWGPPYRPLQSSSQPPPPVLRIQIYFISDFFFIAGPRRNIQSPPNGIKLLNPINELRPKWDLQVKSHSLVTKYSASAAILCTYVAS